MCQTQNQTTGTGAGCLGKVSNYRRNFKLNQAHFCGFPTKKQPAHSKPPYMAPESSMGTGFPFAVNIFHAAAAQGGMCRMAAHAVRVMSAALAFFRLAGDNVCHQRFALGNADFGHQKHKAQFIAQGLQRVKNGGRRGQIDFGLQ